VAEDTSSDEGDEKLLLIVEDDESFARALKRSFERRGYRVLHASNHDQVVELLQTESPSYAVVDLKLEGASGLTCVQTLHAHDEEMNIVVLTGFASIATAVEAIKLGARQYLAKPSNTDDIEKAFGHTEGNTEVELTHLHQDAGVGTHPSNARRRRLQYFRGCPPLGDSSPHAGSQAAQAAGEVSF